MREYFMKWPNFPWDQIDIEKGGWGIFTDQVRTPKSAKELIVKNCFEDTQDFRKWLWVMKFNFIMNLHTFIQQKKENEWHVLISSSIKVKQKNWKQHFWFRFSVKSEK